MIKMNVVMKRLLFCLLLMNCALLTQAQEDFVDSVVVDNWALPMPEIRYGMATICGQLKADSAELPKVVVLRTNTSAFAYGMTRNDTLWASVSPAGTFEFRLPVTHTTFVDLLDRDQYLMSCYVAADDTTVVTHDYYARHQRQSHYSHVTRGPLMDLSNEWNHTYKRISNKKLLDWMRMSHNNHPDLIGSRPLILLPKVLDRFETEMRYANNKYSPAMRELLLLEAELCLIGLYEKELTTVPGYIQQRGFLPRKLYTQRRKDWFKAVEADRLEAYNELLDSPRQLLCPSFVGVAHMLSRIPAPYPDYVANETGAIALRQQLSNYHQLDSLQLRQNLAVLPPAYQQWVGYYAEQLDRLMADNARRPGYRLRDDLPQVEPYHDFELFDRLMKRYRGQTVFVLLWLPTAPHSQRLLRDVLVPLQQEFEDADVAWVNLAYHNNEDSWRQQAPQLHGDHYQLKTSYQATAIRRSAVQNSSGMKYARLPGGTSFYAIVKPDGKVAYFTLEEPTLDGLRSALSKYVNTKP